MTLSVIDKPATPENLATCTIGQYVTLADARRKARRHVRLYRDKAGTPYVRDRLYGRRDIIAVRFLTIDGAPLLCGCAILSPIMEQPTCTTAT